MKMGAMFTGLGEQTLPTQPWVRIQIMMVTTDILALNCYLRKNPEACQILSERVRSGLAAHMCFPEIAKQSRR